MINLDAETVCCRQLIQCVLQGLVVPAFIVVLSRWAPPDKKTFMTASSFSGDIVLLLFH